MLKIPILIIITFLYSTPCFAHNLDDFLGHIFSYSGYFIGIAGAGYCCYKLFPALYKSSRFIFIIILITICYALVANYYLSDNYQINPDYRF